MLPSLFRLRPVRLAILCSVSLVACSAVAADNTVKLRAEAVPEFTDNLFHYSEQQLDDFDAGDETGQDERFQDIDDTADMVTRARLRGDITWDLAKKRDVLLRLDGRYALHARNGIADYGSVAAHTAVDVSRHDALFAEIKYIPDRFQKNYRIPDTGTFTAAHYTQTDYTAGYQRKIHKRWNAGAEYRHRRRRYDSPLQSRNRDGDYLRGFTDYRLAKKTWATSSLELGRVETDEAMDSGVLIDRSYEQLNVIQGFRFDLPAKTDLTLDLAYRRREATTDVVEDGGRFDRVDQRTRIRAGIDKKLGRGFTLTGRITYQDNDSDREDPTFDVDEVGYEEARVALGIVYRARLR